MVKATSPSAGSTASPLMTRGSAMPLPSPGQVASTETRAPAAVEYPVLVGKGFSLRELRLADAETLMTWLSTEEVARFISLPPATLVGFQEFIEWSHRRSAAGQHVCFAVVPEGLDTPVGLVQIRSLATGFTTAEWGFALAVDYWGTGLFVEAAKLVAGYAFEHLGTHRLEARAVVRNGRGNGALKKIGAVLEAVLHRSFHRGGEYLDQVLWAIRREDWRAAQIIEQPAIH